MWIDGNYGKNEDNICIPYCLRWRQRYPRNRGRYHLSAGKSSFDGWRQQASLKFENEFVEKKWSHGWSHDLSQHIPFLRSSGLPFFTVANTISPHAAAGRRFKRPLMPPTAIMYKFLAPGMIKQKWWGKFEEIESTCVFTKEMFDPWVILLMISTAVQSSQGPMVRWRLLWPTLWLKLALIKSRLQLRSEANVGG